MLFATQPKTYSSHERLYSIKDMPVINFNKRTLKLQIMDHTVSFEVVSCDDICVSYVTYENTNITAESAQT